MGVLLSRNCCNLNSTLDIEKYKIHKSNNYFRENKSRLHSTNSSLAAASIHFECSISDHFKKYKESCKSSHLWQNRVFLTKQEQFNSLRQQIRRIQCFLLDSFTNDNRIQSRRWHKKMTVRKVNMIHKYQFSFVSNTCEESKNADIE